MVLALYGNGSDDSAVVRQHVFDELRSNKQWEDVTGVHLLQATVDEV